MTYTRWGWIPQGDGGEKQGCRRKRRKRCCTGDLGFCWKEILPVSKPAARHAALLWPLPAPVWIFPLSELGLVQCGSWVGRCSLVARQVSWRGWKTLPRWAAVTGRVQPACSLLGRGGVQL